MNDITVQKVLGKGPNGLWYFIGGYGRIVFGSGEYPSQLGRSWDEPILHRRPPETCGCWSLQSKRAEWIQMYFDEFGEVQKSAPES